MAEGREVADRIWSPLSEIYSRYHENIKVAKQEYEEQLKYYAEKLNEHWDCFRDNIIVFKEIFENRSFRSLVLSDWIRRFFQGTEIPFVAIDGSSYIKRGDRFISIYGGAYGIRGTIEVRGPEGKLRYKRWEIEKDVSMVAFIPLPPEAGEAIVDASPIEELPGTEEVPCASMEGEAKTEVVSDREVEEVSTIHNKIMQLAEVYLAYQLAKSSTLDAPRLILMDTTLSGWLANTSFGHRFVRNILGGTIEGIKIGCEELYTVLAHPMNRALDVPEASKFLPHYRLIAEAHWKGKTEISESEVSPRARGAVFKKGAKTLAEDLKIAEYDQATNKLRLNFDPREAWERAVTAFERLSYRLFRKKDPNALKFTDRHGVKRYLRPRDLMFLSGIGLRALIETCWDIQRPILLVGIVKDSHSRYYTRNYLGSLHVLRGEEPGIHMRLQLSDRTILEMLAHLRDEIKAPWSTVEFDSAFMTLHPVPTDSGGWRVGGYVHEKLKEYTRPPRIFLKSLAQFMLKAQTKLASHVIFVDRLVYPGWDDRDYDLVEVGDPAGALGTVRVLMYKGDSKPRLHYVTMFLLSVLVKNHFPEALGYPDPLHKADWGAKTMRDRVKRLLDSSWIVERGDPLHKTFRRIRDSFRR